MGLSSNISIIILNTRLVTYILYIGMYKENGKRKAKKNAKMKRNEERPIGR